MSIDKNQAIIDYLITCPNIQNTALYFNFVNAKNDSTQIVTNANDSSLHQPYIDGTVDKLYTFTIIEFKSISYDPINKMGYSEENVTDLSDVQALIDWINEQDEVRNYPNFGDNCIIDAISATSDNPSLDSIDTTLTPALAKYSITIQIEYLDITKRLWNKEE